MAQGMRERKKQQTRRALTEAAYRLFDEQGFEQTTVARIAEAADVSTGTFFLHFATKEDVLFPDGEPLAEAAVEFIADRSPDAGAAEVLTGAMSRMLMSSHGGLGDQEGELEAIRGRLIATVPTVRAKALQRIFDVQERLTEVLHGAFPDDLTETEATVLVGAVVGAALSAVRRSVLRGEDYREAVGDAVETVAFALCERSGAQA